jgi:hypothetical protein
MPRAIGRAFKIGKKDVASYGYAKKRKRGMKRNPPGVTAIAAINGPGSYRRRSRRSARSEMRGLSSNARRSHARRLTDRERAAFGRKVKSAKGGTKHRRNASSAAVAQSGDSRKNARKQSEDRKNETTDRSPA